MGRLGSAAGVVGRSGEDAVEGYRHILRLVSAATDLWVERADPARPLLTEWMSPTRKFLGDNPDTIYTTAPVDGAFEYGARVRPGNAVYVGFVVYGRTATGWSVVSSTKDTDLVAGPDGSFEVHVSAERPDAAVNWLPLDPSAHWLMVREYFADRHDKAAAGLAVERLDGTDPPAELDGGVLADRLSTMAHWVGTQVEADAFLASIQRRWPNRAPELSGVEFPPELVASFLPTPDIDYQGCAFDLAPGESLVVRGMAPDARYWSVQVMNHWLESVDGPSGRNGFELGVTAGEPFEVVLSDVDPGHPGWIPLAGRRSGLLACRTLLAAGDVPRLSFEVVPAGER